MVKTSVTVTGGRHICCDVHAPAERTQRRCLSSILSIPLLQCQREPRGLDFPHGEEQIRKLQHEDPPKTLWHDTLE
ncbi:hypothetical protein PC128_g11213 [Phytophthora cactorum]|nr:hypothetical protein PC128_g11213 [Phytophthora cactorum]